MEEELTPVASQATVCSTFLLENDLSLLACVFSARAKKFQCGEFTEVM
jgi:hypothetical protein